jgi:hypothetical protein
MNMLLGVKTLNKIFSGVNTIVKSILIENTLLKAFLKSKAIV